MFCQLYRTVKTGRKLHASFRKSGFNQACAPLQRAISENRKKIIISEATIVAPVGVENRIERIMPAAAQITEMTAEQIITLRKLRNSRIAESAGKIMSAEISKEPTRFIASTIIVAVIIAMIRLYALALMPDALQKFSSKVTAKIL